MADETAATNVDEAPISPVTNPVRRNSLEHYLKHRPERSELVESAQATSFGAFHTRGRLGHRC